jgi:hypothetical protein
MYIALYANVSMVGASECTLDVAQEVTVNLMGLELMVWQGYIEGCPEPDYI